MSLTKRRNLGGTKQDSAHSGEISTAVGLQIGDGNDDMLN